MSEQPDTLATALAGQAAALSVSHATAMLSAPVSGLYVAHDVAAVNRVAAGLESVSVEGRFAVLRHVAIVPVRGVLTANSFALERWLGWTTYQGLIETLAELSADEDVDAIVLDIDSPGGMVLGLQGAVRAIAAANKVKPVHALIDPLCASAAYHLASQAGDVSAAAGAEIGSIGTVQMTLSYGEESSSGIRVHQFVSSHAAGKRPDPMTEAGQREIRRNLDVAEAQFHADIASGRGMTLEDVRAASSGTGDPADGGALFSAADAAARNLIDQMESRADFYDRVFADYAPPPARRTGAIARAAEIAAATAY